MLRSPERLRLGSTWRLNPTTVAAGDGRPACSVTSRKLTPPRAQRAREMRKAAEAAVLSGGIGQHRPLSLARRIDTARMAAQESAPLRDKRQCDLPGHKDGCAP